jgi:nitroreductase / dihydropteridine reductase
MLEFMSSDITHALYWRYATKAFDPDYRLQLTDYNTILDSISLAPTSFGLQPFYVIEINDTKMRAKLKDAAFGQKQITDASRLLLFVADFNYDVALDTYAQLSREIRNYSQDKVDSYRKFIESYFSGRLQKEPNFYREWTKRQTYIALGFAMETAALLQVDACPIEGFDAETVHKILAINIQEHEALCFLALGGRSADDTTANEPKVRKPHIIKKL